MAFSERLAILIQADAQGAIREFTKVGKAAERELGGVEKRSSLADRAVEKLGISGHVSGASLKSGLAAGALVAANAVGRMASAAVDATSALQEQNAAAEVVFGDAVGSMRRFAEGAAEAFGLSERAALQAGNQFGSLFSNIGATAEDSAVLSQGVISLAADLARFRDVAGGTEAVLQRLQSGLSGEAEPLRRLGVFINENAVKAKAMELGLGGAHRELSDGEKIIARYQLILEQTAQAQGQAAREGDSFAAQQEQLRASLENLQASLGQGLIPAFTGLAQVANDALVPITKLAEVASGGGDGGGIASFVKGVAEGIVPLGKFADVVRDLTGEEDEAASATVRLAEAQELYAALLVDGKGDSEEAASALADIKKFAADAAKEQEAFAEASAAAATNTEDAATAFRDYEAALVGVISAKFSYEDATLKVADAERDVAEKRERLAELTGRSAVDERAVADARRDAERAARSVEDAESRLADARERLAEASRPASERDLRQARLEMAKAEDAVADALRERELAQRRLAAVERAGGSQNALADARGKVADASLAIEEAQLRAADAQERLAEVERQGKPGTEEYEEALRALKEAQIDVADAKDAQRLAGERLRTAERGDPQLSRDIAEARREVERAERDVERAKLGVVTASQNVRSALGEEADAWRAAGDEAGYYKSQVESLLQSLGLNAGLLGTPATSRPVREAFEFGGYGAVSGDLRAGTTVNMNINVAGSVITGDDLVTQIEQAMFRRDSLLNLAGPR